MAEPQCEPHTLSCYPELLEDIINADKIHMIDLKALEQKLRTDVKNSIETRTEIWPTEYVCKPSRFIRGRQSIFYPDNKVLADYECEYIKETQLDCGAWQVTWNWGEYQNEFAISANWWQSNFIIQNILYLQRMGYGLPCGSSS